AIKPGGALEAQFAAAAQAAIGKELANHESALNSAINAGVSAAKEDINHQASQQDLAIEALSKRADAQGQVQKDLDSTYPWRKLERKTDPQEWLAGWRRLNIDRDWLANVAEQMEDPAMANAMAALISNPDSQEASKFKAAVSMRNAPRASWKDICLSSHGGSADRFRAFVSDKAQRAELMPLAFACAKAMKRRAKKAAARKPLELQLIHEDFSIDWSLGLARLAAAPFAMAPPGPALAAVAPSPADAPLGAPARKKIKSDPGQGSSGQQSAQDPRTRPAVPPRPPAPQAQTGARPNGNANLGPLVNEFSAMMGRQQPAAIQAAVDAKFQRGPPEEKNAIRAFLSTHCRQCHLNAKAVKRSRAQCRAEGARPSAPCPRCAQKQIIEYHWVEDCSN
ncbi:unnamed protein product, partial [Prorocentrum cordatum]